MRSATLNDSTTDTRFTGGGGYRGAQVDCGRGHAAQFIDYRLKQFLTVLSQVEVSEPNILKK